MATFNDQKQLILNQVKKRPNISLETLVKLINQHENLDVNDFKGYVSDLLYGQLLEISEWEQVKRKKDLFEVKDFQDNHPNSIFKSEIEMLYYELREEELKKMKACPTEYSKDHVERLIDTGIFDLYGLMNNDLLPKEVIEVGQLPDIAQFQIEDCNLEAPENCTDIYFFGTPGTGKTCLLMGLTGANGRGYTLNMKVQGSEYASALQEYVRAGITPGPTFGSYVTVINCLLFGIKEREKGILNRLFPWKKNETNVIHPINLIEMSGVQVTLADMDTGVIDLLKNKNRKVFFLIIDPTKEYIQFKKEQEVLDEKGNIIGYESAAIVVDQRICIKRMIDMFELEENEDVMKNVDAIHFVITKADTLGETEKERQTKAKELLLDIYEGPVQQLKDYCRRSNINYSTNYNPCVFTFSLGKFYLGNVFDYDQTDSIRIIEALRTIQEGITKVKKTP